MAFPKVKGKFGKGGTGKSARAGNTVSTMNLAGPQPFEMSKKKPEPDDKPRPISSGGVALPKGKGSAARLKRLSGVSI